MDEHAPSPHTTLAILLGASAWLDSPDFHGSEAFANVARDFRAYLLNSQHFGLPEENFLDLFDTEQGPDKIDRAIRLFLDQRTLGMQQAGKAPRDLLFYFVGHGGFAGRHSEYYLAVRCTSSEYPLASGIRIESLATTLTDRARHLRRFIILDCCYAAAAFTEFQAEGPAKAAVRQAVDAFTDRARRIGKGTSLLCSSGKKVTSLLTPDRTSTMFSKALLQVLTTTGNPHRPDRAYLSLHDVADLVEEALDQLLAEKAPRPELHSPDQVDGDVADVPFFPNSVVEAVPHARLGNYRLVRLLGHGGFANVYLGEHIHLNTHAAIKLLHTSLTDDERAKFLEEARTIALLEHPHIVRVLEYGVEHETPFLVMNYAPGGTLRQLHPKGTRLPPATIVSYVEQVAEALQYAHDQKIVHRDVKPENTLLGRGKEVLLSDFGIAVIAHSTQSQALQEVGGTAPYMAPEQIQGKPSPASDQYALGVVVYEWLSGNRPFQGNLTEIYSQHLFAPPPSLHEKDPMISSDVEQVVKTALAKDPGQRFASVRAFAYALEQACLSNDQTVPVVPPPPLPLPRGRSKVWTLFTDRLSRRKILVGLASLVAVGGGLTGVTLASKTARGTLFHTFPQDDIVYAVAWSPDGNRLASADNNAAVQIWDTASGAYVLTYRGHTPGAAGAVAWSPDGQYVASGGSDATVQVWEASTGHKITTYTGHTGYTKIVNAVAWSPNGKYLASAGEEGSVQVRETLTWHLIYTYKGHIGQYGGSSVNDVAWSPDSNRIASASSDYTVQVWDATTGRHVFTYQGHSGGVLAVAWSPDGMRLASGSSDDTVQVWSPSASGTLHYSGHTDSVQAVAWSSDGQHLASGSSDQMVRVWDLSPNGNPYVYRGHTDEVYTVAWSPGGSAWPWSHEGQRLASGGKETTVRIWQAV
jgi:eukaryotic-like serine/threonine-protein kinase